jgi:hypothetical protein
MTGYYSCMHPSPRPEKRVFETEMAVNPPSGPVADKEVNLMFLARMIAILALMVPTVSVAEPPVDHLPAPQMKAAGSTKRTLTGIDCTFGVACPIIWQPPRTNASPR